MKRLAFQSGHRGRGSASSIPAVGRFCCTPPDGFRFSDPDAPAHAARDSVMHNSTYSTDCLLILLVLRGSASSPNFSPPPQEAGEVDRMIITLKRFRTAGRIAGLWKHPPSARKKGKFELPRVPRFSQYRVQPRPLDDLGFHPLCSLHK